MSETPMRPVLSAPSPRGRRRIFLVGLCLALVPIAILIAAFLWAGSAQFEGIVRKRIVAALEQATGGRVEIASFHWQLTDLEADLDGVVIHGLEAANEDPYARVQHVGVHISILGMLSPRVLIRDLEISHPEFHLIVYPDGSTNQPQSRNPSKPRKSALNTIFDLQAGHVTVDQGIFHFEDRAADFDFQNREALIDFDASNVSLLIAYSRATANASEFYRIELGAADLNLARVAAKPTQGTVQATLDLARNTVYLRSMRITSVSASNRKSNATNRALEISGILRDFAHPRWQAQGSGDVDMKWIDPATGFPFSPQGMAHLDLTAAGEAGEFRIDGGVHIEDGSYVGTGVSATGVRLDAHVHADPIHLLITSIVARLREGGQLEGTVALDHWLPPVPGAATMERPGIGILRAPPGHVARAVVRPPPPTIPVNGKVTAQIKDLPLDSLLDTVGQGPFQRLGLDARLNGPAIATWIKGDAATVTVSATLKVDPTGHPGPGENPVNGTIDATYTQHNGAVDLRKLEVQMPGSQLTASGNLGAFPLTTPTDLSVDLHSGNLAEFDIVLRDLGLSRNGKTGAAALPITLAGQADFHGTWNGSLLSPHIAGTAKATQLSIEIPAAPNAQANKSSPQATSQFVRWDSIDAKGSYSAERIVFERALLRRGDAEIALDGALDATPGRTPEYDGNSNLHLNLRAAKIEVDDLQPFIGQKLPVAGALDAQIQVNGPIHTPGGAGWVELSNGSIYGEPLAKVRAQGTLSNQLLNLTSVTANAAGGSFSGTGSYDLKSRRFQIDARGASIDVAKIESVNRQDLAITGKLGFSVFGSGSFDDPHLDAHATLNDLALGGEPLGVLKLVAHSANRSITYDATTGIVGAELTLHGQTALSHDYATQAHLDFSHFDIGAILKMAHVQSLSGESALAGTVTVQGPLAHPEQVRGEAHLQQLAVTLAGVHLQSQGGVHATLANERINLDPLNITGEETDLRLQGSLGLKDKQQLDLAASGSINLKLAQTLDRDLTASGTTTFQVEAHGPLKSPELQGRVDFQNGSLSLEDIPNGLSQLHGTLEFNQNRLEVKSLTAMSGGGLLSVGGYLAYQHGIYADLSVTGKGIRIRYPQGVSSQADASFHLQGTQNNLLLGGEVLITRFTMSPDLDIAALAAQANIVQTIAPPDAPSNHIRLDVHVLSSPQLNFQNAYAKLAGDVDLRLRGTVASPSLLGRVSITEGSALIAGTRYDLQSGVISFTNPVRIEPSIDLSATARVEDYDITLGLHGTPDKLGVTYRSEPPLPEADVVALLALGRTESQQRLYTQQQEQSLANPTTDSLLGGALNATVSSRVQKLFGAGSVKVDPNYLGALGNSTSRIIVEEQLGRNLTLTFATDVDTTSQQLLQAEFAINRHVSLLVARDESGVFSMVVKATRRYR